MSCLLYCIVGGDCPEPRRKLGFLGYPRASIAVRAAKLGAVVSQASTADLAPDIARLLAYAKVIESYNRERTVIPMRYGCTVGGLEEVRQFLERRRSDYLRILAELEGRVEMSVRIAVDEASPLAGLRSEGSAQALARFASGDSSGPGITYLARRSEHYARREGFDHPSDEIRRRICEAAEGTFVRWAGDFSQHGRKRAFAVHFLVPRAAIRRFIEALQPLRARSGGSLAVTGPWPPYNFVRPSAVSAAG
jgi:hypothetical protein